MLIKRVINCTEKINNKLLSLLFFFFIRMWVRRVRSGSIVWLMGALPFINNTSLSKYRDETFGCVCLLCRFEYLSRDYTIVGYIGDRTAFRVPFVSFLFFPLCLVEYRN